jgi:hypothetical protein
VLFYLSACSCEFRGRTHKIYIIRVGNRIHLFGGFGFFSCVDGADDETQLLTNKPRPNPPRNTNQNASTGRFSNPLCKFIPNTAETLINGKAMAARIFNLCCARLPTSAARACVSALRARRNSSARRASASNNSKPRAMSTHHCRAIRAQSVTPVSYCWMNALTE